MARGLRPRSSGEILIQRLLPGLEVRGLAPEPAAAKRGRAALRAGQKAALWGRLEADAKRIAEHFGLRYSRLEPEREGIRAHYGITYSDGTIRIRLRHAATGRPLKYSSLVNTVCHELAHLKHFNHGERFKALTGHVDELLGTTDIVEVGSEPTAEHIHTFKTSPTYYLDGVDQKFNAAAGRG